MNMKSIKIKYYVISFFVVLFITLPFHYVFYDGNVIVFAKENFTFSKTIVTETDVTRYIENYNNGNMFERLAITNEPLHKKLVDEGIIYFEDKKE